MKTWLIVTGIAALIAAGIYWELQVWDECRQTNSFMYCMGVISK